MAFVSTLFERFLTRFRTITSQQVSGRNAIPVRKLSTQTTSWLAHWFPK